MKKRFCFFIIAAFSVLYVDAAQLEGLSQLDSLLARKEEITRQKETAISLLRKSFFTDHDHRSRLTVCRELVRQYAYFQYDSAKAYADRGLLIARQMGSDEDAYYFIIHKARILSTGGIYDAAYRLMSDVPVTALSFSNQKEYCITMSDLYRRWAFYCRDKEYSPQYFKESRRWLTKLMTYVSKNDPTYNFYHAKYLMEVEDKSALANIYYLKVIHQKLRSERFYARACYSYACNLWTAGERDAAIRFMAESASSDIIACTFDNSASKTLADFLIQVDPDNSILAEKYINVALNDAKSYNNRLRLVEISQSLIPILTAYKAQLARKEHLQFYALIGSFTLIIALLLAGWLILRQYRTLKENKADIDHYNQQLTGLNHKLGHLNERLLTTNIHRENLAAIYIHLCSRYIEKLKEQRTLVLRKLKTKQTDDLLLRLQSERASGEETSAFLDSFDRAFLELYPTFREEFSELLQPEFRTPVRKTATLTTTERIAALCRLGVDDTSETANLLFSSTQSIYNRKSELRSKMLNKETMWDDIKGLCRVIKA